MAYEPCLCGATDCRICGPLQGYHVCDRFCERPCYEGDEKEMFCIGCGNISETEVCQDCQQHTLEKK